MNYRGYIIKKEFNHYVVSDDTVLWTEDTIEDAKHTIDELYGRSQNA